MVWMVLGVGIEGNSKSLGAIRDKVPLRGSLARLC